MKGKKALFLFTKIYLKKKKIVKIHMNPFGQPKWLCCIFLSDVAIFKALMYIRNMSIGSKIIWPTSKQCIFVKFCYYGCIKLQLSIKLIITQKNSKKKLQLGQ